MIALSPLDYTFIIIFFGSTLAIGIWASKSSGKDTQSFFLSGRNMPWWLLGFSMVATTFSTDTPNLVTDIVRKNGVSGNWVWWAFLVTGLLTVFVYAKLWRKSNVSTDLEFYNLRYGGKPANFLRAFRALYLGVLFNVLAMSGVILAAIKIGQVMLGLTALETIGAASVVTLLFSVFGGFKGVVYTDFLLFFTAMIGAIGAAYYAVTLPEVGGISNLISHPQLSQSISVFPNFEDTELVITLLIIPLAVQWWSSWYPGAEPGGGGYIAQRMLAAKNENHAITATFFFNIMHYALRPWPWILVALASLVIYPKDSLEDIKFAKLQYEQLQQQSKVRKLSDDERKQKNTFWFASRGLSSLRAAFPKAQVSDDKIGDDLAYSAMLTRLPKGWLGLVLASLIAAFMSTLSTHLNWGASYIVHDFYVQQIRKNASQKEQVRVGRLATVVLLILSTAIALLLTHAKQLFDFILLFGAGTGLLFILRWFWWRINAWSEISAMFASGLIALLLNTQFMSDWVFHEIGLPMWSKYPLVVGLTTGIWITITLLTKPEKDDLLIRFHKKIQAGGPGWTAILRKAKTKGIDIGVETKPWSIPASLLAVLLGLILVYGALFATAYWIYGEFMKASILTALVICSAFLLYILWKSIRSKVI